MAPPGATFGLLAEHFSVLSGVAVPCLCVTLCALVLVRTLLRFGFEGLGLEGLRTAIVAKVCRWGNAENKGAAVTRRRRLQ